MMKPARLLVPPCNLATLTRGKILSAVALGSMKVGKWRTKANRNCRGVSTHLCNGFVAERYPTLPCLLDRSASTRFLLGACTLTNRDNTLPGFRTIHTGFINFIWPKERPKNTTTTSVNFDIEVKTKSVLGCENYSAFVFPPGIQPSNCSLVVLKRLNL
jgi:hypothetical protein